MEKDEMLLSALWSIPVASLTREEWIDTGMALKQGGHPVSLWDEWSRNDDRYKQGECDRLWNGFNGSSRPLKPGYIIKLAERNGWSRYGEGDGVLDWSDPIGRDADDHKPATQFDHLGLPE